MDRPRLADVIEHYGGNPYRRMIHCVLHEDRTPSCSVNHDRGLWNCHSCGRGGDVWTLIELKEGVDFAGAQMLVQKYGLNTEGEEETHGNRFTGTRSGRITARDRQGRKATYRPRFLRG